MDIILYLLQLCNYLYQQNLWLISFICRYIPLRQWAFDDSHSPRYQKFKVDRLPVIQPYAQDRTYQELIPYWYKRYGKWIFPVKRRGPYCEHSLVQIKDRKHFVIHKCINLKCSYYVT